MLAPLQVVIIPIYRNEEQLHQIDEKAAAIVEQLKAKGISVKYDNDDAYRSGWKFNEYEFKGVPVRIAIGPKDLENNQAEVARRDTLEKQNISLDTLVDDVEQLLKDIQQNIYDKALAFRKAHTVKANTWDEFKELIEQGLFIEAHWDGTTETEEKIKEETKATIRCIPLNNPQEEGKCIYSGKPSKERVIFARAY